LANKINAPVMIEKCQGSAEIDGNLTVGLQLRVTSFKLHEMAEIFSTLKFDRQRLA